MALVVQNLKQGLISLFDEKSEEFRGFPASYVQAANNLADVLNLYGSQVTPPTTTANVAKTAFITAFIANQGLESIKILSNAIDAYAKALIPGMLPNFVGVAPSGKIVLDIALEELSEIGVGGASAKTIAELMADKIDTYFKTGTATNSTTGVVVTWL